MSRDLSLWSGLTLVMAPRRLPRGTRKEPVTLGYDVEKVNKDRWAQIASQSGMSPSALFDRMVETIELDESGRHVWLPAAEGLPIDRPD